jgi:predicted ArsR family transcriptional regulator
MIKAKRPATVDRINQIMRILRARVAGNSQIAKELGISTALAQQYTAYLRSLGCIRIIEAIKKGGRPTNMLVATRDAPAEFFWSPKSPPILVVVERPKGLTTWVGGNPYERLAA